jgi:TonB-dependent SusC/RagA subfamily outer membrane receptor
MGIQRDKKTLTVAIQTISGDELRSAGDQNFMNALNGKIAGLQVYSANSGPGSSISVDMRGSKAIGGRMLYALDGVPMTNNRITGSPYDYGDGLSQININDIESITVLKSANAAILYGSAGANGAILITTKKVNVTPQNTTSQSALGQRTIMGKVIGGEDGHGISGVTVVVKGTSTIALTDRDGNFALKVPNDAIIIVMCMGFRTVGIPIENKTWYEIMLQPEI